MKIYKVQNTESHTREVLPASTLEAKPPNISAFRACNDYTQSALVYDLYMAVISNCVSSVRNILLSYPDLDANLSIKGSTVLSLSLYKRHFSIFHLFMRHQEKNKNIDLNKCSKDHLNRIEPPIVTCCRMHFVEGVVSLVNRGADIDSVDNYGHTALWMAARQQMPSLVEYLISNGASVNKTDKFNYTPLLTALMYRTGAMILKLLILHGSNLEGPKLPVMTNDNSPLFWAAKHGNLEISKLILMAGVSTSEIRRVRATLSVNNNVDRMLYEILDTFAHEPLTLKQQCRRFIRTYISETFNGKDFTSHIEELPLPNILKHFLLLR